MSRVLTTHGLHVNPSQRDAVLATLRERKALVRSKGCNYWVFEDSTSSGVMLEFVEGPDAESLATAREAAGLSASRESVDPVFIEVEL